MASSLLRLTRAVVPFRPTSAVAVSAYRQPEPDIQTTLEHSPKTTQTRPFSSKHAFDRSVLGKRLCEMIGYSGVKSKSFTAYKKDTGESIYIKGNLPGVENKEGLCVSLNMPGFELEDVENDMIKREMQDGLYKVTLPHADVNRLAFRANR